MLRAITTSAAGVLPLQRPSRHRKKHPDPPPPPALLRGRVKILSIVGASLVVDYDVGEGFSTVIGVIFPSRRCIQKRAELNPEKREGGVGEGGGGCSLVSPFFSGRPMPPSEEHTGASLFSSFFGGLCFLYCTVFKTLLLLYYKLSARTSCFVGLQNMASFRN